MDDFTHERWLPVVGWEGLYEISDLARVWSHHGRGRFLRQGCTGTGYPMVMLCAGGQRSVGIVHRLVAEAFLGPCPSGMEVRHLDGDKMNSRLPNLTYGSHSENERDKVRHGTHQQASKTHCKNGHEFTPANTIIRLWPDGTFKGRLCRLCAGTWSRKFAARKRAAGRSVSC